ncbi:putative oxygenase MesX [Sphingomonas panni]|uniref:putative oxygenase MesX n=1 Tax=Sphingomonas panni TaxID=237612 RepID=UPI001F5BF6A1|nr:putative oxygenase MesX [Sphingomonas panni]
MTSSGFAFTISSTNFDEDYRPADDTRLTTNFANLARGPDRRDNLRRTMRMIDHRFNALMHWDNPTGDRYAVTLQIVSAALRIGDDDAFPLIEMLHTVVTDRISGGCSDGMVGNNFSSYVRDYDFSVVLPGHRKAGGDATPDGFGDLHGNLFKQFVRSNAYRDRFRKAPVICLSVSSREVYHRTANVHPILGVEYRTGEGSTTDDYFAKMGMKVRYFMPPHGVAPLAFYHVGDLVSDYSNLELASTISTMETFQKIYRPEIYNANSVAAERYRPSLDYQDYSLTRIVYDREERSRLAIEQGRFAEETFIKPHGAALQRWSATAGH